ncbi:hypothetical protein Vadar_020214 [Vaccinium darrowii]|uniref:Uncharacterized protein n=1 Tax=Vaccinium darrowii TaxID=229202 RepID=A0ACB7XB44_9ERIC|nr:hypothetical protein Vadar_020214 [Vaccinium darrowii]
MQMFPSAYHPLTRQGFLNNSSVWYNMNMEMWHKYDAFEIGFITTDDFINADILEATYPAVAKRLLSD